MGATFSAQTIRVVGDDGVSFSYGDGMRAFIGVSALDTRGAFTLMGPA